MWLLASEAVTIFEFFVEMNEINLIQFCSWRQNGVELFSSLADLTVHGGASCLKVKDKVF